MEGWCNLGLADDFNLTAGTDTRDRPHDLTTQTVRADVRWTPAPPTGDKERGTTPAGKQVKDTDIRIATATSQWLEGRCLQQP